MLTLISLRACPGRLAGTIAAGGLALAIVVLLGIAGSARAAGPSWLPAQRIEPGQAPINGLSCPSLTTCLAASAAPVVQDGGPSFEPETEPDPATSSLNAVSCAPGTRFCMFVDDNGGAFTYSSGTFGALADIDGNVELDAVSCPSSTFCTAVDHNHTVFNYKNGSWNSGTVLSVGTETYSESVNVSCSSATFCVALASTSNGELFYTWNGTLWSAPSGPFDPTGVSTVSLSCTSTTFCLETDKTGHASVFTGSSWSAPAHIDTFNAEPELHSSCVGTTCVAVDFFDNFLQTSDGTTWTSPVDIHASTLIAGVESLTCESATLCVAGDGEGNATTYAVPPSPGTPTLTGTPTVGQTLTLTHASVQSPSVWYIDNWRRCETPETACSLEPISTSTSSDTLVADDANQYIDALESFGFGFDEEGPIVSNIVGPISGGTTGTEGGSGTGSEGGTGAGTGTGGGTTTTTSGGGETKVITSGGSGANGTAVGKAKLSGAGSTTSAGVVTISLTCAGGLCTGSVKLTNGKTIGSATFSIVAGHTGKIKIKLTAAGKKQLKKHKGGLSVKVLIQPTHGKASSATLKLKLKV
jgi:hypothetical protein